MNHSNRILVKLSGLILVLLFLTPNYSHSQVVNESAKKRFSIAIGMFTDIWFNVPTGIKTRTINQGANVFATYNMPFGKSNFGFSVGLGLRVQNLYGNFQIEGKNDSLKFVRINDTINYQRSKVVMPYIELPIEFRFKTKYKLAIGIGFKVAYMLPAHTKWVGDDYIYKTSDKLRVNFRDVKYLEKLSYGPTLRIGYKWFHVNAYYSLSKIFKGYNTTPLSIGFLLMPF